MRSSRLFNPLESLLVKEPLATGKGWWAGAPGAFYDQETKLFYLFYRLRKPREGEKGGRGFEGRIAVSSDGINFKDIWSVKKEELDTPSLERGAILKSKEGKWLLYLSYVNPIDNRWKIDVIESKSPDSFRVDKKIEVLTAQKVGTEGVKDPRVYIFGDAYYMLVSYADVDKSAALDPARLHSTADAYNTGLVRSCSGLAVSMNGITFGWLGGILFPTKGRWDAYASRLNSMVYIPPVFVGFYDGAKDVTENYEEKTGIAQSTDFLHWHKISTDGPVFTSPYASGSLRYVDVVVANGKLCFYFEWAREDGSHELRVSFVDSL